jgi:hypothetical protein
MKIKFLKDREVEADGRVVESYRTGEVYEMTAASARRWIRRLVATEVQGVTAPKRPETKPAPVKAAPKKKRRAFKRKPPITSTKKPSE